MNQIVVKRVFNKDAFIPGHPYAILTQTKTVYGLFSHYENEQHLILSVCRRQCREMNMLQFTQTY